MIARWRFWFQEMVKQRRGFFLEISLPDFDFGL
jgi:hypothetical protein